MIYSLIRLVLTCAVFIIPTTAFAATVTVVHGINGLDLNLPRSLQVDIAVNGSCAFSALTFGSFKRTELPQGTYRVTVHPSTGNCSGTAVIDQQVTIPEQSKNVGLVAQIGDSGVPRLVAFVNDSEFPAVIVNNASPGASVFAGSGNKKLTFFYAIPLANGDGKLIAGFGRNRKLEVVLIRTRQKRPFFQGTFTSDRTLVLYLVGSLKSGQVLVSERVS